MVCVTGTSACGVIPNGVAMASGHRCGVGERRQLDHPHAVGVLLDERAADLDREPRLADAADAGQRHEPVGADELDDLGEQTFPTDEARARHGQVAPVRLGGAQGRVPQRGAVDRRLEQALGTGKVGQAVNTEVHELDTVEHRRGPSADEHLSTVRDRHDPSCPARCRAHEAAVALVGRSGFDPHPASEAKVLRPRLLGKRALRVDRGVDGGLCVAERHGEPFSVSREHAATVPLESLALDLVLASQRMLDLGRVVFPQ